MSFVAAVKCRRFILPPYSSSYVNAVPFAPLNLPESHSYTLLCHLGLFTQTRQPPNITIDSWGGAQCTNTKVDGDIKRLAENGPPEEASDKTKAG